MSDAQTAPCEYCPDCGCEVYNGTVLIKWEDDYICARCVLDKLQELKNDPEALAMVTHSKTRKVTI